MLEYDELHAVEIEVVPAELYGQPQSFLAVTLSAVFFLADPDAELGRTVHAVDAVDLDVADDGRVSAAF